MNNYPNGYDGYDVSAVQSGQTILSQTFRNLGDALSGVQNVIGLYPTAAFTTVSARISGVESTVSGLAAASAVINSGDFLLRNETGFQDVIGPVGVSGIFSQGINSISQGAQSSAFGSGSLSIGYASHSQGQGGTAYGDQSHAEGYFTFASGENSHAGGKSSSAMGNLSYARGHNVDDDGFSGVFAIGDGQPSIKKASADNQFLVSFENGMMLSGTDILNHGSGINNLGTLSDPFNSVSSKNINGDIVVKWTLNEVPSPDADGIVKDFTLVNNPVSIDSVQLYHSGIYMYPSGVSATINDYQLRSGNIIHFDSAPSTGAPLIANYTHL